jgi:isoleucyl-tRNA synthetase
MGSLYLDITKDRLYTMRRDSRGRRSAQTAMAHIVEAMARWLAPILSFTAEEIWQHIPGERGDSVLFETWYAQLDAPQAGPQQRSFWTDLLVLRSETARLLEAMRNAGAIGSSLQAEVTLYADAELRARYAEVADELRFFFITSRLELADSAARPVDAVRAELNGAEAWIGARTSEAAKCIRCWHHVADVGTNPQHPEICGRCIENVEGTGEDRRWF